MKRNLVGTQKNLIPFLAICFGLLFSNIVYNSHDATVYGHLFTRDQTGTFVSIIDQVQTELELVAANLVRNNVTLAENHATKASSLLPRVIGEIGEDNPQLVGELMRSVFGMENISSTTYNKSQDISTLVNNLNEKLDNAKIIRIAQVQPTSNFLDKATNLLGGLFGGNTGEPSSEQVQNSRIEALAFAELMDAVLVNYGKAYNVGYDMTNMSNMIITPSNKTTASIIMSNTVKSNNSDTGNTNLNMNMNMNMNMDSMNNSSSPIQEHMGEMDNGYQLIHIADYQTCQALAKKGLDFFNSDFRHMANNNKAIFVNNLEKGLKHLNNSLENKGPPTEIMRIVHTEIHPNLLEAFNLELRK
ncbi:MAG: hypothetical protein QN715_08560 [Nitrososphaeraceae archaeon]|nr:hypothetical protein [Nitrososphaeraceae archaeon]